VLFEASFSSLTLPSITSARALQDENTSEEEK
jgi:hypothetical protein